MINKFKKYWQVILLILIVIAPLTLFRGYNASSLLRLGYLGIFFINFITSVTVIIPIPGAATAFLGGAVLNPILVGISAGIGATMGEIFGYFAGSQGSNLLKKYERENKWLGKVEEFFRLNGFITIFICAFLPFPLFDFIGILAGVMRYPILKFILATLFGRVVRDILFAWSGAAVLPY